MRGLWCLAVVLLGACAAKAPQRSASPPSGMVQAEGGRSANDASRLPGLTMEVLPSMARTGTVNAESLLLQRPTKASVILKTLTVGAVVQVLGTLDNADGHWLSVGIGDSQGWVRATEINL